MGRRGRGGAARRLAEFLAGVRRTKIEAGRYTAGWTRLKAGGRRRRATASWSRPGRGPRGGGQAWAWRVAVTAGDRTTARWMPPPVMFRKGGGFLPPHIDHRGPVDGNDLDGEDKKWMSNMSY